MVLVTHGASVRSFKKTIEIKWKALVLLIEFLQTFSLCCKKGSGHEHPLFRYTDLSAIYKYRLPISEAPLLVIFLQIAFVVAPGWPLRCNDCRNSKVRRSVHICMCFVCVCIGTFRMRLLVPSQLLDKQEITCNYMSFA